MIRELRAVAVAVGLSMSSVIPGVGATSEVLRFGDLVGWANDDHDAALAVFLKTCADIKKPDWVAICKMAAGHPNARTFFELLFRPVLIGGETPALFTGYYEPELNGARYSDARFRYPIYRKPPELVAGQTWQTRKAIEDRGLLRGRGLEIAWIDNPVDVFFLQIQGSGRIRLRDGSALRVSYGGSNGRNYASIGQELVRRGVFKPHQVSADVIRNWVQSNPVEGRRLLQHNPSYVFFRVVKNVSAARGPLGAMNRSITAMRTVAVDPSFTPLGAPVWIEKGGRAPLDRLMIAQDTGSAIKGAQRADIFFGTGKDAGHLAGQIRDSGRMIVLLPITRAYAMAPGG